MTAAENINQFAKEAAEKLNQVNYKVENLIDDSAAQTAKVYSSQKIEAYIDDFTLSDFAGRLAIKTPLI